MPSPTTIPAISNTWTPASLPVDAYAEAGSASQPVGLGSAKAKAWFFSPTVNVKAFGAAGDGTTDDTAAFNAAIAALAATGGTIVVPIGVYRITSALTPSLNIRFVGAGMAQEHAATQPVRNTSILKDGNFTGITLLDGSGLENLNVDGAAANGGDGVHVFGDNVSLTNVGIWDHGNDGLFVGADSGATGVNWCNFRNVVSGWNTGHGFRVTHPATNSNGHVFHGCRAWANTGNGFRIGKTRYNSFMGCYAEANTDKGWKILTDADRNNFLGCSAEPIGSQHVVFDSGSVNNVWFGGGALEVTDVVDNGQNLVALPQGGEGTKARKGMYVRGQIRAGNDPQDLDQLSSKHGFLASGTKPGYNFYDENGPDSAHKIWEWFADVGVLYLKIVNFAASVRTTLFAVTRSAADSASWEFTNKCTVRFSYPPIVPVGTYAAITALAPAGGLNNGGLAVMTDLNSNTPGAIAANGGTKRCLVWCDGTGGAWVVVTGL